MKRVLIEIKDDGRISTEVSAGVLTSELLLMAKIIEMMGVDRLREAKEVKEDA